MNQTLITNDCLAYFIYQRLKAEYASPFIGCIFEDDYQYLKFCQNYDEYIQIEPVIAEPKLLVTIMGQKIVPAMFLGDIEIHWPHEKDPTILLDKYKRRFERITKPMFLWSDMQIYNAHTPEELQKLKSDFKKISNSMFIEKDDIEEHRDKSIEDLNRDRMGSLRIVKWLDYNVMASHVIGLLGGTIVNNDVHLAAELL